MLRRLARANDQDSGSHSFLLCSQFQTQAGAHTLLIIEWVTGCELFGSFRPNYISHQENLAFMELNATLLNSDYCS